MTVNRSDHLASVDSALAEQGEALGSSENARVRRRRRRTDWREGGRSVRRWDLWVLSVCLLLAGVGVLGSAVVARLDGVWASGLSTLVLWVPLVGAIVFAVARARPAGLFRIRPIDLLWGGGIGIGLRVLQGWIGGADHTAFPTVANIDGSLPQGWLITTAAPTVIVAPVVEELFFHAVVLVAIYQQLRRAVGAVPAGVTALLASAGGFVLMHAAFDSLSLAAGVQLFIVGATCAAVVLLTGRIWGAVLVHVVYNLTFVLLVLVGTLLS